jgi:hypothetical protein
MAPIHMLWIGPRLSALERLSMASFLAHGHEVRLYTYGDVEGIPPGVMHHDGREIVPASQVFTYASGFGKGSYAGFANLFRYKLLLDHGGIWCDCDIVCLRPFDFTAEYVIGRERLPPHVASGERTEQLANCVLKVPPNSRVMLECYAVVLEVNKSELEWGETGPRLVTQRFARHQLDRFSLPPSAFCPIDWWNAQKLVSEPWQERPESYAIHFWNEAWRFQRLDKDATYPPNSIYETLKRRYGVSG